MATPRVGAAAMAVGLGMRAHMGRSVRGMCAAFSSRVQMPRGSMFPQPQARWMSTGVQDDEYPNIQPTPPPGYVRGTTFEEDMTNDPYAPHKENMRQAKEWITENIKPGMTREEMMDMAEEAFKKFIPPMRSYEEIMHDYANEEQVLKERRRWTKDHAKEVALRKIPVLDELGRAHAVGKRKEATARIYVAKGAGNVIVNKKLMVDYFHRASLRDEVFRPFQVTGQPCSFDAWVLVEGGGLSAQAQAIKLAGARALQAFDPEYRTTFKRLKLLTQDDRRVERKKPGQPKARKKFQWVKR